MIVLKSDGFAASAYRASYRLWRQFCGDRLLDDPAPNTNLCLLIQTITVRAPLAIAFNAFAVGSTLGVVGYFLFLMWLNAGTVGMLLVGILAVALGGAAIYFIGHVVGKVGRIAAKSETTSLVLEYAKAKKARVCPLVEIKENTNAAA